MNATNPENLDNHTQDKQKQIFKLSYLQTNEKVDVILLPPPPSPSLPAVPKRNRTRSEELIPRVNPFV